MVHIYSIGTNIRIFGIWPQLCGSLAPLGRAEKPSMAWAVGT